MAVHLYTDRNKHLMDTYFIYMLNQYDNYYYRTLFNGSNVIHSHCIYVSVLQRDIY